MIEMNYVGVKSFTFSSFFLITKASFRQVLRARAIVAMLFSACRRVREALRVRAIEATEVVYEDSNDSDEESIDDPDPTTWLKSICCSLRRNDSLDTLDIDAQKISLADNDILTLYECLRDNHVLSTLMLRNIKMKMNAATFNLDQISISKKNDTNNSLQLLHIEESGKQILTMGLSLTSYNSLRTLNLKGNFIDSQSAETLGQMLKSNGSLRELHVCHNRFDSESIKCFANGLKSNQSLKILSMLENGLDDVAVTDIVNAVAHNNSLEFLCLDFNDFGYLGIQTTASMLKTNKCLKELHLFGNRIDSSGAELLADALCNNSTLRTLIISYNQIGDQGATALAKALTVNTTLTKLWCPSNHIGNEGLQAFGKYLPKMKGLEELHVDDLFDDFAAEDLIEGLKFNTRLTTLYIESPIYDHNWVERQLDFYLRLNRSGRSLFNSQNAPLSLWAAALEKANKNCHPRGTPDVLYSMLHQKPDLFDNII